MSVITAVPIEFSLTVRWNEHLTEKLIFDQLVFISALFQWTVGELVFSFYSHCWIFVLCVSIPPVLAKLCEKSSVLNVHTMPIDKCQESIKGWRLDIPSSFKTHKKNKEIIDLFDNMLWVVKCDCFIWIWIDLRITMWFVRSWWFTVATRS